MKKPITRILLFITAVPAIIAVILFLPQYHYLGINILFVVTAFFSTLEAGRLILKDSAPLIRYAGAVLVGLLSIWTFIETAGISGSRFGLIALGGAAISIFVISLMVPNKDEIPLIIKRATAGVFLIIYPGIFFIFCIRITGLSNPSFSILLLILTVFSSDALAYIMGKLFGKHNRIITQLSPKKTLVGFVTELVFCSVAFIIAARFFPSRFPLPVPWAGVLGFGIGITSIIGDLFESALKRAADVKDSGKVVPGRGGLLDSIDSLLFSAPLFYIVVQGRV